MPVIIPFSDEIGSRFLIQDYGDQVKITHTTTPRFTYDARWEGEYVLVRVYDLNDA